MFVICVEYDGLQIKLHDILHILMVHSFCEVQDGWRIWVDTTAMLHYYVSDWLGDSLEMVGKMGRFCTH